MIGETVFVTGGSGFVGRHLIGYLVQRGVRVRALARSPVAAAKVREAGAEPVRGHVLDADALTAGMEGCSTVFHAAAHVASWARFADFYDPNVRGTLTVVRAAQASGVARLVHVSTEAVLADGKALRNVDETYPIPARPLGAYARTKALAERIVQHASTAYLTATIVRPRFVWGAGDTSLLPQLVAAARLGRFAWIGGGWQRTSTCHVDNLCEGLWCAALHGAPGACYFVTDGAPVVMREFGAALMRTQGIELDAPAVPRVAATVLAAVLEPIWRGLHLQGVPPVTRAMVATMGCEVTLDDRRARDALGYRATTTIADGLRTMDVYDAPS